MCGEEFSFDKRDRRAIPADPVAADTLADRVRALAEEFRKKATEMPEFNDRQAGYVQGVQYAAAAVRALLTEEPTRE